MIYIIAMLLLGILVVLIAMWQNKGELTQSKPKINKLHFKNNVTAFEYAEKYLSGDLVENMAYVGIVEGVDTKEGTQQAVIKIAVNGGASYVFGFTNSKKYHLTKGNLILWGLIDRLTLENDIRIVAAGTILAVIAPSHDVITGKWDLKYDLTTR